MNNIELLPKELKLPEAANHVIQKVLSGVEPDVVKTWVENLQIKDGRVIGTFYSDLGARLPFNGFVALYEALGYRFSTMDTWMDWWCYGALGCTRQPGYTCDPDRCP
jgi:hypothetical protein